MQQEVSLSGSGQEEEEYDNLFFELSQQIDSSFQSLVHPCSNIIHVNIYISIFIITSSAHPVLLQFLPLSTISYTSLNIIIVVLPGWIHPTASEF